MIMTCKEEKPNTETEICVKQLREIHNAYQTSIFNCFPSKLPGRLYTKLIIVCLKEKKGRDEDQVEEV